MSLHLKYKSILERNGINTPLRLAHFFAQVDHESGGFKYTTELGNKAYFNKYEVRKDLGNTQSGDGYKFRGRGYIQITGRANYTEISKDLNIDFVNNPDLLSQEANAMLSAIWFWNKRKLNAIADRNDIVTLTKRINGGNNGLADRKAKFEKWSKVFNV